MPHNMADQGSEWLTPAELARELKYSRQSLANMRCQGRGPKFTKLGEGRFAPVRYRRRDVSEWLKAQGEVAAA